MPQCLSNWGVSTPTGIRTQDLVLIRHDTRYKLAALTAELWGRGHDIDGVEEADAAGTGGAQQRESRLPQMAAASVVFSLCSIRHALTQTPRASELLTPQDCPPYR